MEGIRPMLIATQALVSPSVYGTPQRSATGFDSRRMNMLLAVLEQRCGFRLVMKDVFLNITGGIRIDAPAIYLGLVCSIISSHQDIPLSPHCFFAAIVIASFSDILSHSVMISVVAFSFKQKKN